MSKKELTAFRLSPELLAAMRKVKEQDGIPVTVQMEKAVEAWLKKRGVIVKSERKRAVTRKRS